MTRDYSQVNFRIPTKLKDEIESAAFINERSITAELVTRLQQSFDKHNTTDISELKEQIARMDQTIQTLATTLNAIANKQK